MIVLTAWRNIWRHPKRTCLLGGALAFVSAVIVVSLAIKDAAYDLIVDLTVSTYHGQLQIQPIGYLQKPSLHNKINNISALKKELSSLTEFGGLAIRAETISILSSDSQSVAVQLSGVEPQSEVGCSIIPTSLTTGKYLSPNPKDEILIGSGLAKSLAVSVGSPLTVLGQADDGGVASRVVSVAGIFKTGSPTIDRFLAQMHLSTMQEVFGLDNAGHRIVFNGAQINRLPELQVAAQEIVMNWNQPELVALSWEQVLPGMRQLIEMDTAFSCLFLCALIGIVSFTILSAFSVSLAERMREFGLLIALGLSPNRICFQVVLESTFLSVLSLSLGTIIGAIIILISSWQGLPIPGGESLKELFHLPMRLYPVLRWSQLWVGFLTIFGTCQLTVFGATMHLKKTEATRAMRGFV